MAVGLIGVPPTSASSARGRPRTVVPPTADGRVARTAPLPVTRCRRPVALTCADPEGAGGPAPTPAVSRRSSSPASTSGEPGRPVRGDPDRNTPVLLVHMAGRVLVRRVVVAGRGHRRDVQHALGHRRASTRSRNRSVPVPAPSASSSGGVAETSSRVEGP